MLVAFCPDAHLTENVEDQMNFRTADVFLDYDAIGIVVANLLPHFLLVRPIVGVGVLLYNLIDELIPFSVHHNLGVLTVLSGHENILLEPDETVCVVLLYPVLQLAVLVESLVNLPVFGNVFWLFTIHSERRGL